MRPTDYRIDTTIKRTTKEATLWKSDNAIVQIEGKALAVKVLADDEPCGRVFWGGGSLLIDTIVDTKRGAIGKSLEKEITEPFIMIGGVQSNQDHLKRVEEEDIAQPDATNREEFLQKAERLVEKLLDHSSRSIVKDGGLVFAFPNEKDELDLLVVKGSKLVFKGADRVFVAKGDNVVLTGPQGEVAISKSGRSVVVSKHRSPHVHICAQKDDWW